MDIRQLRYFLAIAEAGSVTKASEMLHVAQPALSLQLANLEAHLGTRLFDRFSRGVKLTTSGQLLLEHAKTILRDVENATRSVRCASERIQGRVSVGFPTTVSTSFLGAFLHEIHTNLPGVLLHLAQLSTARLRDMLTDGALDMAILMDTPEHASVSIQPLLIENFCLVSPHDMPPDGDTIDWKDLTRLPLLLSSRGSQLRFLVDETARRQGDQLIVRAELDSARLLLVGVHAGLGYAILPRSYLIPGGDASDLLVRKIVNPELRSSLYLASLALTTPRPEQLAVRELLVRLVRECVAKGAWDADLHQALS